MTMNCGFDNRIPLPPFFPVLRNSDGVFAQMLLYCRPHGLIGHLPLAVMHEPPAERRFAEEAISEATVRFSDLLILLVQACHCPMGQEPGETLRALAARLGAIGDASDRQFSEAVRYLWLCAMSRQSSHLETLLERYEGEPGYWARDVGAHLEALRPAALRSDVLPAIDVAPSRGQSSVLSVCRRLVKRCADLLVWWPSVVEAAGKVRTRGESLARRV